MSDLSDPESWSRHRILPPSDQTPEPPVSVPLTLYAAYLMERQPLSDCTLERLSGYHQWNRLLAHARVWETAGNQAGPVCVQEWNSPDVSMPPPGGATGDWDLWVWRSNPGALTYVLRSGGVARTLTAACRRASLTVEGLFDALRVDGQLRVLPREWTPWGGDDRRSYLRELPDISLGQAIALCACLVALVAWMNHKAR